MALSCWPVASAELRPVTDSAARLSFTTAPLESTTRTRLGVVSNTAISSVSGALVADSSAATGRSEITSPLRAGSPTTLTPTTSTICHVSPSPVRTRSAAEADGPVWEMA